ncbi:MAG: hypothetical protein COB38_12565 [Gammaproteobacteria bacterium]|nr:MAG: hypothetical protein COB38_12565 [Gammaproteobacteria bacterium]
MQGLKETSAAFVILKGFDSILLFIENAPVIGKLLTPYREFLERMSFVMLISFFSLGLQKIIIVAMQSFLVNALLTINVVTLLMNKINPFLSSKFAIKLLKLAVLIIFVRFAIPVMTFAITSIQSSTAQMTENVNDQRLADLEERLFDINKLTEERDGKKVEREKEICELNDKLVQLKDGKELLEEKIDDIKNKDKTTMDKMFSVLSDNDLPQETKNTIEPLNEQALEIQKDIDAVKSKLEFLSDDSSFFELFSIKQQIKKLLNGLASTAD